MSGITKTFGSVVANHDVSIEIQRGEILSLLGENGSGKTTLMNMLSGIYCPDSGQIEVDGKEVSIRSPKDALSLGIGMIHQHYKLVDVMNATQNIILGLKEDKYDLKADGKVGAATWGRIESGWIHMYYVKLNSESVPAGSVIRTVTASSLRIRAGAGTKYDAVGNYLRGTEVVILEQTTVGSQRWGRTDKGWISLDYVK
jgi:ABC-type sugar transport system ATPase subunit